MLDSPQPFLGRLRSNDPRSRAPQFRLQRPREASQLVARSWLAPDKRTILNQRETPHCVAYSALHYLMATPVVNNRALPAPIAIYDGAQAIDEWPGTDYEGTSVNAGLKVLRSMGYIERWEWAYDANTAIDHLLARGPLMLGTTWFWDMFEPDAQGYIWPTGPSVGGHAFCLVAANRARKNPDGSVGAARILNSWGADWGQNGRAWISFKTLQLLIEDWGEVAYPVEVKKANAT